MCSKETRPADTKPIDEQNAFGVVQEPTQNILSQYYEENLWGNSWAHPDNTKPML